MMSQAALPAVGGDLRPLPAGDGRASGPRAWLRANARRLIAPLVATLTTGVVLLALRDLGSEHSLDEIRSALAEIPVRGVGLALLLTVASYAIMVSYDRLAFVEMGEEVSRHRTAWTGWIGCASSLFLGFPLLTAAPVRFRMYGAWGIDAPRVARVVAFVFATLMLGLLAAVALVVPWAGLDLPGLGGRPALSARVLGPLLALPVAGYLFLAWRGRTSWERGRIRLSIPPLRVALLQVGLSALDWILAGAVLYALLPEREGLGFWMVISAYLLAQLAGLISQVPGGLGVVETVLVVTLAGHLSQAEVLGSMLAYRVVYILLPFLAAIPAYLAFELSQRRPVMHLLACCVRRASSALTPHLLGVGAYLAGLWVLVIASLPVPPRQIAWTLGYVSPPVLELTHVLGSAAGVLLLVLARGLQRRLDGAYRTALVALAAGALLLIVRGQARESLALIALLVLLLPMRGEFFRRSPLFRSASARAPRPSAADLCDARRIGDGARTAVAHFAQLQDKSLFFNPERTAYLMYAVRGRSWIALGEAVGGSEAERAALVWRFRDACDAQGSVPVFYQIPPDSLPLFLDMGLTLLKLGEEARVSVRDFSLEGSERSGLRRIRRKLEKDGYRVRLLSGGELESRLPELEGVSREWLRAKRQREKGFSLGFWDADYVRGSLVLAVERVSTGTLHAFVTLLRNEQSREEVLSDLMRYDDQCPWGVMDFLLMATLEWAREEGYAWLNLGMAPLSGIEGRQRSPLWSHLAATLFEHGEDLYGFRGIRRFKEKYDPVWRPKYLASLPGLTAPRSLASVTALISAGSRPGRAA